MFYILNISMIRITKIDKFWLCVNVCVYTHTHHICKGIYVFMYIWKEREKKREDLVVLLTANSK